ncbi:MAG: Mu transposase C-terminal domain-containing protein [Ruminococcus sp.]|nr:Mu transposase C-terminal domain-containing protein [Ruminococcus sp.]
MDYLTVKEAAELKGCSERYIKKLCKDGVIQAEVKLHPQNKRPCYMIPISALPEELKAKYYKRLKSEAGTAPELKETEILKPHKKVIKKAFEEYTAEERTEIALWCKILREWQELRIKYKNKAAVDADYVGKCRIEYGESIEISVDILYRKYAAYKENNYDGLIDKRGGWNKGLTSMNEEVWKMFTRIYLVSSRPTLSRCYTDIKAWTKTYYPELYCTLPSERTFRRRVDTIPDCVIEFTRYGKKACFDKYLEYIERDYTDLNANDIWIADNHTLDVISMSPEGKPHRLSLMAYMDAKSGVIVGWNLCDNPCSQSTLLAFRAAVMNGFGVPLGVYFDNGSEFLTHDIAGRGHRKKANWNKGDDPPTILSLLGVTMTNALVKNAKAKNIERYFYTFKEFISKAFSGYSGGTILERPEDLAKKVKNGEIPTDAEIAELLSVLINGGYNCKAYGGKEKRYSGMSRIDVWNESINSEEVIFRDAADEDLTLLMARTSRYQKIHRNGVYIEQYGKKIWFKDDNTVFNVGKEVYVRFDPAELDEVRVYDRETDKYLWTYRRADYLNIPYAVKDEEGRNKIAVAMANIARNRKAIKQAVASYTDSDAIDVLAARINEAAINMDKMHIQRPKRIQPITADELNEKHPGRENIISVEILDELAALKAVNDKLEKVKGA